MKRLKAGIALITVLSLLLGTAGIASAKTASATTHTAKVTHSAKAAHSTKVTPSAKITHKVSKKKTTKAALTKSAHHSVKQHKALD